MSLLRSSAVLLLALLLASCSDRTSPTDPSRIGADRDLAADRSAGSTDGLKTFVVGHAEFAAEDQGISSIKYSVEAKHQKDGSTEGELELWWSFNGGERMHGRVFCFTVVGNMARMAALVTKSESQSVRPGSYLVWNVVDNDSPGDREPDHGTNSRDLTSFLFLGDQAVATAHCATGFNVLMDRVNSGNLEVRPSLSMP